MTAYIVFAVGIIAFTMVVLWSDEVYQTWKRRK